jgi:hypothetical protein
LTLPAPAAPIVGTLGFGGPGVLTFSSGGGAPGTNFIDWCPVNIGPSPGTNCGVNNNGTGSVLVDSTSGDFDINPFLSPGTILDITDNPASPAPYTFIPLTPTSIPNFLDFSDPWSYTLTDIEDQVCAPSATEVCTGYFKLTQVGSSVSVNFAGLGEVSDGVDITPFTFLITGNFANQTIASVVSAASSPTGIFSNSWSGELNSVAPIPEPGIAGMTLLGFAILGVGAMHRRRKA